VICNFDGAKRRKPVRKFWKLAVAAGAALSALALLAATPAAADPVTFTGYGFDGNAHVLVLGGSETTYYVMNSINRIYQESSNSGCLHKTAVDAAPAQNVCDAAGNTNNFNLFNWQGDTVAQANPTGSGGGVAALNGGGNSTASPGLSMQGAVNPIVNSSRTDAGAGTTIDDATVTDAAIGAGDLGKPVRGTTIPEGAYVGTVTPGVSFELSSDPHVPTAAINAIATGVTALVVYSNYACAKAQTGPEPDMARSSRGPSTNTTASAGSCTNELAADTFWGYGQDGNEIIGFNNRGALLNANNGITGGGITAQQALQIWSCQGGTGTSTGPARTDTDGVAGATVTVSNGTPAVTDSLIQNQDVGHSISGTGIPAGSFVGKITNSAPRTFLLSSSATSQVPVTGVVPTANGNSVTIQPSQRMRWSDILPAVAPGSATDTDIVPWGMNAASGTFGTFNSWVIANANNAPSNWTMNDGACVRRLSSGNLPLENDIKPLINDSANNAGATSPNNPENWLWQGSFANFSAFSNLSKTTVPFPTPVDPPVTFQAVQARVNNNLAGFANILDRSWPISRVIFHVTRKADADCPKTQTIVSGHASALACDFNGHLGPALPAPLVGTDMNVTGGASGVPGAIREFTRAMCRETSTQQGFDPYTGTNFNTGLTSAIQGAGFTTIKATSRTPGSRCQVQS
jgi:hypothetical protein